MTRTPTTNEIVHVLNVAVVGDPIRYPALTIMPLTSEAPIPVSANVTYYVEREPGRWAAFWFNTPNGYRAEYNEEPVAGGDDEAWANRKASVLHNGPHNHEVFFGLQMGAEIELRGTIYSLEPTHNGNISLARVGKA